MTRLRTRMKKARRACAAGFLASVEMIKKS